MSNNTKTYTYENALEDARNYLDRDLFRDAVSVEYSPMRDEAEEQIGLDYREDGGTWYEACKPEEAEIWSVYVLIPSGKHGFVEASLVEDYDTQEEAELVARAVAEVYGLKYSGMVVPD